MGNCGAFCALCLAACKGSEERKERPRIIWLGEISALKEGLTLFPLDRIALLRRGVEISAVSLVCTHQECLLRQSEAPGAAFECPCHGSLFGASGEVLSGPATEALSWYEVLVNDQGLLGVNLAKTTQLS